MPNWKIHLEIGNKLNESIHYSKKDLELFLLGNILPDINNGYMIEDVSKKISHGHTHFQREGDPTYLRFLKIYGKSVMSNPLMLGYFVHLYTDYFWNDNFRQKAKNIKELDSLPSTELRILKQQDFRSYNNYYLSNVLDIKHKHKAVQESLLIDRVSIQESDLDKVVDFLHNQKSNDKDLKYYTKQELDDLLEETIQNILNFKYPF